MKAERGYPAVTVGAKAERFIRSGHIWVYKEDVEKVDGGYDVCCANIVADVIIRLAPDIAAYLAPDAVLIVSGIITERRGETVAALNKYGFEVADDVTENGWYCAALKKRV